MKPTYRVKDWDKHFENHESRKLKRAGWVSLPNRHDGKSFRRIAAHAEGVAVFAGWTLILEVASKMPTRGILADEDGPLDADDLAAKTGFPASIFDAAFNLLTQDKFGWLEAEKERKRIPKSPASSRNLPESPDVAGKTAVEQNRTEGNGTEQKEVPARGRKKDETPLPEDLRVFIPELQLIAEPFRLKGLDVELVHQNFVGRADRDGLLYKDWKGAFRVSLTNALKWAEKDGTLRPPSNGRMPTLKETMGIQ